MLKNMLDTNTFVSLKILEALMQKNLTDEEKAKIIAEGFAELESRYPDLKYHATKDDITTTKLELIKEIEATRKEIKELDIKASKEREKLKLDLSKEIKELDIKAGKERENIRKEIKELDIKASKEIKELDVKLMKEIAQIKVDLTKEIENSKIVTLKWTFIFWSTQMIAIGGILYRLTQ